MMKPLYRLILGGVLLTLILCTGCTQTAVEPLSEPESELLEESVESRTGTEPDSESGYQPHESHKQLFDEQPLPVWMAKSLASRKMPYEFSPVDWFWEEPDDHRIALEYRGQFSFTLTAGSSTETIEGLTVDMIRYNESNQYRTWVTMYSLWADENYLLAAVDNEILVYEIASDHIKHIHTLDYSEYLEDGMQLYLTYFEELEQGGMLLAATVREEAFNHMTVISLMDESFEPYTQNTVASWSGLGRAWDAEERSSYRIHQTSGDLLVLEEQNTAKDGWDGSNLKTGNRSLFIRLEDDKPVACEQMYVIFDDARRSDPNRSLLIYQKSVVPRYDKGTPTGQRYQHLVLMDDATGTYGFFVENYNSSYDLTRLDSMFSNLTFTSWYDDSDIEEREMTYELTWGDWQTGETRIEFPGNCVSVQISQSSRTLSLLTNYTLSFLQQYDNHILDTTSDGRFQIWKVRVITGHESQSSSYVVYDSQTGAVNDFNRFRGDYYTISFLDDGHAAVIDIREPSYPPPWGLHDRWDSYRNAPVEQTITIYNLLTGEVEQTLSDFGELEQNSYIRAYTWDPIRREHVLLINAHSVFERNKWINAPEENSWSMSDYYCIATFGEDNQLRRVGKTDVYLFYEFIYVYAPATLRVQNGEYLVYSLITKGGGAAYTINPDTMETEEAQSRQFYRKLLQKNLYDSLVKGESPNLSILSYAVNEAFRVGAFTASELKLELLQFVHQLQEQNSVYYLQEQDVFLEIQRHMTDSPYGESPSSRSLYLCTFDLSAEKDPMQTRSFYYRADTLISEFVFLPTEEENQWLFCAHTDDTLIFATYTAGQSSLSKTYLDENDTIPDVFAQHTDTDDAQLTWDGFSLNWRRDADALIISCDGVETWRMVHQNQGIQITPIS